MLLAKSVPMPIRLTAAVSAADIGVYLLTNRPVTSFRKGFFNSSSKDIKLSKPQLYKIIQSEDLLGRLLGPLMKVVLPLTKNILTL